MKLLVVGASGLVGSHIMRVAREQGHDVRGTYRVFSVEDLVQLDLSDAAAVEQLVTQFKPDAIVCCASWSWVDGCEREPERAFRDNRDHPLLLALNAEKFGAAFLHFSTSYVFDGMSGPYREDAPPKPISVYGRAKLAGEEAVLKATHHSAIIARTMGVYGEELQRKNFVCQVIDNLKAGKRMRIPTDQLGNVTYAGDLAKACLMLLEKKARGIWNLGGPDPNVVRSDFAVRIARAYGLDEKLFDFVTTAQLNQPAPRPLHGGLVVEKARHALNWHPAEWVKLPA